ncbi:AFG2-interacting ribosome maturation factor isoform X2 [Elgaria multicarinata webbii]
MASEGSAVWHTIHCLLKKCFCVLQEQHEVWKKTLVGCTPLLDSLTNLAEQMQASQKVAFASTPLGDFPCLPERLWHKQRCAVEALLKELQQDKLLELQKVRDAVGAGVARIFLLCELQGSSLCLESSCQRSALCPSLADMLEGLLDVEGFYHHIYLEMKLFLLQVSYENLTEMEVLPKALKKVLHHGLQNVVEDVLLKVSFFREAV